MDKETRELFKDVLEGMRLLNAQAAAQATFLQMVAGRVEKLDRQADAQSEIIRALSGDERVLHEHD